MSFWDAVSQLIPAVGNICPPCSLLIALIVIGFADQYHARLARHTWVELNRSKKTK